MTKYGGQTVEVLAVNLVENKILEREPEEHLALAERLRAFGQNGAETLLQLRVETGGDITSKNKTGGRRSRR